MSDVYLIFRTDDFQVLYKGGSYGFRILVNSLHDLTGLAFRVIKKRRRKT